MWRGVVRTLIDSIDFILKNQSISGPPVALLLKIGSERHPEAVGRLGFAERLLALSPDDDDARKIKAHALLELKRYEELRGEVDALCATAAMWDDDYVDKLIKAQTILEKIPLSATDHQAIARLLDDEDDEGDDDQNAEMIGEDSEDGGDIDEPRAAVAAQESIKYKPLKEIMDDKRRRTEPQKSAPAPSAVPKIIAYVSLFIIIFLWLMAR